MLNNYVFFNLSNYNLKIKKVEPWKINEEKLSKCIKCYTTFFPETKIFLTHKDNNLILIKKGVFFSSKTKLDLLYCIKIKENEFSISYQIFNLSNKHLMDLNISSQEDIRFRFIFNKFFIFTDFELQFSLDEFKSNGLYVKNYKIKKRKNNNKMNEEFFGKVYDKSLIQYNNLQNHLIKTFQKLMKLNQCSNIMKFFNFYEDQNFIYIISTLPDTVKLPNFLELNKKLLKDGVLLNFLKNLIDVFINFEKMNIQFPFLCPNNIEITLHHFNKELFGIQKKIYLKLKKMLESRDYKNMSEDLEKTNNLDDEIKFNVKSKKNMKKRERYNSKKLNNLFDSNDLTLGNNSDINNFVPVFINTDFLFDVNKIKNYKQRKISCGFQKIIFLSNLFTNMTKNLNCINLGLIYFYIISNKNYCLPIQRLSLEENSELYYINFPNEIIKKLPLLQKQILFYFFTSKELKEIEQNLLRIVDFEEIINEKYIKDQSINITTSKESSFKQSSDYKLEVQKMKNELQVNNLNIKDIKLSTIRSPSQNEYIDDKFKKKSSNFFFGEMDFGKRKCLSSLNNIVNKKGLQKLNSFPGKFKEKGAEFSFLKKDKEDENCESMVELIEKHVGVFKPKFINDLNRLLL